MNDSGVRKIFNSLENNIERGILNTLMYVGEVCVNHARSVNTYHDQTGNLRNSIGYVITQNGQILHSNFERKVAAVIVTQNGIARRRTDIRDGMIAGEELAEKLAANYPFGYAVIVVAGMNYAAAVESRGLDVLTSAELLAEEIVPGLLRDLKEDILKNR